MCWLLGYAGLPAYVECSLLLATAPINLSWGSWEWYVITSGLPLQYPIEWRNIGWSEHIFGLRQKNVHAWICIPSNVASSSMIYLFTAELNDFSSISPWDMLQLIYTHIYIRTPSPCQVHPRELSVWRGDTEGVRLGCEFWGWWRMLVGPCWSLVTPNLFSGCIIVSSSNWVIYIYIYLQIHEVLFVTFLVYMKKNPPIFQITTCLQMHVCLCWGVTCLHVQVHCLSEQFHTSQL